MWRFVIQERRAGRQILHLRFLIQSFSLWFGSAWCRFVQSVLACGWGRSRLLAPRRCPWALPAGELPRPLTASTRGGSGGGCPPPLEPAAPLSIGGRVAPVSWGWLSPSPLPPPCAALDLSRLFFDHRWACSHRLRPGGVSDRSLRFALEPCLLFHAGVQVRCSVACLCELGNLVVGARTSLNSLWEETCLTPSPICLALVPLAESPLRLLSVAWTGRVVAGARLACSPLGWLVHSWGWLRRGFVLG